MVVVDKNFQTCNVHGTNNWKQLLHIGIACTRGLDDDKMAQLIVKGFEINRRQRIDLTNLNRQTARSMPGVSLARLI